MDIVIKRIYEDPSPDDGYRVLVDRHKPENFDSFKQRYLSELDSNSEVHPELERMGAGAQKLQSSRVTLLYGAKSPTCNHAIILRDYLIDRLKSL